MPKLFLTYSWNDDREADVGAVAQRLRGAGVEVVMDRTHLAVGDPLWPQIETLISSPVASDAWAIFATANSLGSPACAEELDIALNRAIETRGREYPLIGLFPSPIDRELIPGPIRRRLYVDLRQEGWLEHVVARLEKRPAAIEPVSPVDVRFYRVGALTYLEVRPRAHVWFPFLAAVPAAEAGRMRIFGPGPRGRPPAAGGSHNIADTEVPEINFVGWEIDDRIDATTSAYLMLVGEYPTRILVGAPGQNVLIGDISDAGCTLFFRDQAGRDHPRFRVDFNG